MADELYLISGSTLTDIGDAIRDIKGTTAKIQVGNYASEIRNNVPTYHTVTFRGFDNETLATYQVKHGESVVYTGKTPISSNGKLFSHWNLDTTNVTSNKLVSPVGVFELEAREDFTFENTSVYYCKITSYSGSGSIAVIPTTNSAGLPVDSITDLSEGSFFDENLTSITIGFDVDIGKRNFQYASNLADVYFLGTLSNWFNYIQINFYGGQTSSDKQAYNKNFWMAPRIHTTDGCIIQQNLDS